MLRWLFAYLTALLILFTPSWATEIPPPKPAPPPQTIPDMRQTNAAALCVDCDEPFDTATHKKVLEGLLSNPYVNELRKALYHQDTIHQFESKAHFDNCDFDAATAYITNLLEEVDRHVTSAQKAKATGDSVNLKKASGDAFFTLGQALHGVQDFYAHTNYVELQVPLVKKVVDIEILAPWRDDGRDRISKLRQNGLLSGFVFWGFPQKCPSGTISHGDLAKDSANTNSGARLVKHLQNLSHYRIAVFLAREASLSLLRDAFKRWPLLKELNGPNVTFEVILDRRGI